MWRAWGAAAGAKSADSAASELPGDGAAAPRASRAGHAVQRSRANLALVEDFIPPPVFDVTASPPPFLRGPVLRLWALKQ